MNSPRLLCLSIFMTVCVSFVEADAQDLSVCQRAFAAVVALHPVDEDIAAYQACATSTPRSGLPHYNLGILFQAGQNWSSSAREFGLALKLGLSPDLTQTAQQQLRVSEAHAAASPAAASALEHTDLLQRANAYLSLHQYAAAAAVASRASAMPDATWRDDVLVATIAYAYRDYDAAVHALLIARQKAPEADRAATENLLKLATAEAGYLRLIRLAESSFHSGQYLRAGDTFSAAWQIHPEKADVAFNAINSYLATPQSNRSLPILNVLAKSTDLKVSAQAIAIRASLADIDRRINQRRQQSSSAFKALLERYKNPENLTDLSGKKLSALIVSIQAIIASDKGYIPAHQLLAFCYSRQKNYVGAVSEYRQVLALNPHARVWYWLARALYNSKQYAESISALEQEKQNPSPVSSAIRVGLLTDLRDAMKN